MSLTITRRVIQSHHQSLNNQHHKTSLTRGLTCRTKAMMEKEIKNMIPINRMMEMDTDRMNMATKRVMINNKGFTMMMGTRFHKRRLKHICVNNKNRCNTRRMNKIMERRMNTDKSKMNIEI